MPLLRRVFDDNVCKLQQTFLLLSAQRYGRELNPKYEPVSGAAELRGSADGANRPQTPVCFIRCRPQSKGAS